MRYWAGKIGTIKEGQVGTMADNGYVPDSVEITAPEYEILKPVIQPKPKSDIEKLIEYAKIQGWIS